MFRHIRSTTTPMHLCSSPMNHTASLHTNPPLNIPKNKQRVQCLLVAFRAFWAMQQEI
jgi:hypothetical protein